MRALRLAPVLAILALVSASPAAAAEKPKPRVVLIEADGPNEELSAFVARFESELSDGEKVAFSDARLSGTSLGALVAEPEGETTRAFRAEWPGETWLAVSLSPCRVEVSRMRYNDTTPEGYRVERVVEMVRVDCPTSLRLVDAVTGKEGKPLAVTGSANYRRNVGEDGESSELEGTRDAAKKAAKKLPSLLKK
ncbi:MAG TPA: hypothetical protein VE129_16660 [Thermoanaerobaculia bacterium]|nr:hypothetical protein [Thermoanaerobaculia bacterium]